MDMNIAGSGQIASGEYENIRISGSGKLVGHIRCASFHSSGSSKGDSIECTEEFKVAGSSKFSQNVVAKEVSLSGAFSCGGNIKCEKLRVAGLLEANGDIEAENVTASGVINCTGLLNAEEITINFSNGMEIGSIGGSKIVICENYNSKRNIIILPLFSNLVSNVSKHIGSVRVKNSIEGDSIALEKVIAERVSGRIVAIGEGCKIDLVQYSEQIEISPDAKVGRCEKI